MRTTLIVCPALLLVAVSLSATAQQAGVDANGRLLDTGLIRTVPDRPADRSGTKSQKSKDDAFDDDLTGGRRSGTTSEVFTNRDASGRIDDVRDIRPGTKPSELVQVDDDKTMKVYDEQQVNNFGQLRIGAKPSAVIVKSDDSGMMEIYQQDDLNSRGGVRVGAKPDAYIITADDGRMEVYDKNDTTASGIPRSGAKPMQVIVTGDDGLMKVYDQKDLNSSGVPRVGAHPVRIVKPPTK